MQLGVGHQLMSAYYDIVKSKIKLMYLANYYLGNISLTFYSAISLGHYISGHLSGNFFDSIYEPKYSSKHS